MFINKNYTHKYKISFLYNLRFSVVFAATDKQFHDLETLTDQPATIDLIDYNVLST